MNSKDLPNMREEVMIVSIYRQNYKVQSIDRKRNLSALGDIKQQLAIYSSEGNKKKETPFEKVPIFFLPITVTKLIYRNTGKEKKNK